MPRRNRHVLGDYLVTDDISGFVEYASDCALDWRGFLTHKDYVENRNPQEFIRAKKDPIGLTLVRPLVKDVSAYVSAIPEFVGGTDVLTGKNMIDKFYVKVSAGVL